MGTPSQKRRKSSLLGQLKIYGAVNKEVEKDFAQFPLNLYRFRSIPFVFRHSLKPLFPCVPHRTVAENVVKNAPCHLPETVFRFGRGALSYL